MAAGRLLAGLTSTTLVQLRIAWVILESRGGLMLESADRSDGHNTLLLFTRGHIPASNDPRKDVNDIASWF